MSDDKANKPWVSPDKKSIRISENYIGSELSKKQEVVTASKDQDTIPQDPKASLSKPTVQQVSSTERFVGVE